MIDGRTPDEIARDDARSDGDTRQTRYRAMDTSLGRWTRQDPAGHVDGVNTYQHVRSNPVLYLDPAGKMTRAPSMGIGFNYMSLPIFGSDPWYWYQGGDDGYHGYFLVTATALDCACNEIGDKWYLSCFLEVDGKIFLDEPDDELKDPEVLRNTYGHEQRHARAFRSHLKELLRQLQDAKSSRWSFECENDCAEAAFHMEDAIVDAFEEAAKRMNNHNDGKPDKYDTPHEKMVEDAFTPPFGQMPLDPENPTP